MQTGLFWRHLAQWCLGASGLSQLRLKGPKHDQVEGEFFYIKQTRVVR